MAVYAHFLLQNLYMLPSTFLDLPQKEQAFVIASTQIRVKEENKQRKKIK